MSAHFESNSCYFTKERNSLVLGNISMEMRLNKEKGAITELIEKTNNINLIQKGDCIYVSERQKSKRQKEEDYKKEIL